MRIGMTRLLMTLVLLLGGTTPAAAQHGGDMLIGSTANDGGSLAIQLGFDSKIQLAPSVTIGGTTVYTATDPGFDAILADGGVFVLNTNTQISVQILSFDAGASVKVRTTVLDTANESALLGTYSNAAPDALHHHPTWTLTLPNGVYGDYDLAFRLTTTSSSYTASQTYAVVLTNATPAPTPTTTAVAASPTPTASVAAATATPSAPVATPTTTPTPVCAAAPRPGCRMPIVAGKSSLTIVDKADDAKDSIRWKLLKGPITPRADYGDPLAITSWAFCLYDALGTLRASAEIPAGGICAGKPCWKATKTSFAYADKERTPDGVQQLSLKEGLKDGRATQSLEGKGVHLDLPALPLLAEAFPLTVQLQGTNGICFATVLPTAKSNTAGKLVMK
jgi:hypothetical protein